MKRLFTVLTALMLGFALAGPVGAAEFGTRDEAVAIVKAAIAHAKSVGTEKAAAEFMDQNNKKWHDRDLYVVVIAKDGIRVAHGTNPKLAGKSFLDSVDVTGKAYGKETMEGAAAKGSGWVEYTFKDPVSQKNLPKEVYYEKNGDLVFLSGVYKR
jgi:signal transduction histidine kinase